MAGKVVINPVFEHSYDVDNAITSMEKGRLRGIDLWRPAIPRVDCTVISIIMGIGSLNRNITMHEDSTTRALPLWRSEKPLGRDR